MQPVRALTEIVVAVALVASVLENGGATASAHTSKGAPVSVMTMGDFKNNREWPGAVNARFKKVNGKGGIKDTTGVRHKVKVIVCDTKFDVAQTEGCAHRAVEQGVVAVIGMASINSDRVWPVLEAAGIPVVGSRINMALDGQSKVSFPLGSGVVGVFTGMPQLVAAQGARKVGIVVSDFGNATTSLISLIETGLRLTSASEGPVVRVPLGATDLASYVRDGTAGGVDGLIGFVTPQSEGPLLDSVKRSRFAGRTVTQASLVNDSLVTRLGEAAEGTLVVGEFVPLTAKVPGIKRFRDDMLSYNTDLSFNEGALTFWLAAWVFERVAQGLPKIDAPSVLAAMGKLQRLDMGGVAPPLSTSTENPDLPRLFNPTVTFGKVRSGQVVPVSTRFFNPLAGRFVG